MDAVSRWPLAERLRDRRRLAAILLLGLTGGIILALLFARGELGGVDARAYWVTVRLWLGGEGLHDPASPSLPYVYTPWTLYYFLPWGLLPWSIAWFFWRGLSIALFAWTVGWAYQRRPLATAVAVAILGAPLAANLDTGNVNVLIVVGIWAAQFTGPRLGGALWATGVGMKVVPVLLFPLLPARARLWGVAFLGVAGILTLATWPQTLRQIELALSFPRPPRLDYLIFAWAAVPWLWRRPWPPSVRLPALPRSTSELGRGLRSFFGYG
jgi:hypothetical protein